MAKYSDEDGNWVFKDFMLEEISSTVKTSTMAHPLVGALNKIVEKDECVPKIVKRFLLEQFSMKNKNIQA